MRGYLRIVEIPKEGLFGKNDYQLEQLKPADRDAAAATSRPCYDALFEDGDTVEMSDLKNKFYTDLAKVKSRALRRR